jgi:hypothetical protein
LGRTTLEIQFIASLRHLNLPAIEPVGSEH